MRTQEKTPQPQTLSFGGKVDVILAAISVVSTTVWSVFTSFRRSEKDAPSLLLHVGYASLRKATRRLSVLQLQLVYSTIPSFSILTTLSLDGFPLRPTKCMRNTLVRYE